MVLAGRVETGKLYIGARALLRTPSVCIPALIFGVERDRQIVTCASAGDDVALIIRGVDPAELPGGVELDGAFWTVTKLLIENAPKRWWEFWH
jgi:translation elongation factor EF-Tu-like GTPase